MRITLDKENDALYFRLDENRIVDSEEIKPGVIVDYDADDRVVGVEFLNISRRASKTPFNSSLPDMFYPTYLSRILSSRTDWGRISRALSASVRSSLGPP